jgi:SAM-dependent methyltransferase
MNIYKCNKKKDLGQLLEGELSPNYKMLELMVGNNRKLGRKKWSFPGFCEVCKRAVNFEIDYQSSVLDYNGNPWPNFRERQICPLCNLNSRQRLAISFIENTINSSLKKEELTLYLMEQITPVFNQAKKMFDSGNLIGSEFIGPDIEGGKIINGVRHEDVENLSLSKESIDIIVSNDVMEHVNDPIKGFEEIFRVLKKGGRFFLTIPFWYMSENNVVRAKIINGQIEYYSPKLYHQNPMSESGSLVFTDFGWELIEQFKEMGFVDVEMVVVWSYLFGHIDIPCYYFDITK